MGPATAGSTSVIDVATTPALRYLTRADVRELLPGWHDQIDLAEDTAVELAAGRVEMPPKPGIHPRADAFIHAMPAHLVRSDVAALKWVSGYPTNKALGVPYINGLLILNEAETGIPIAIMDCVEITAARTAAASGVCVRRWAPAGWRTAAILGCGEQGAYHAAMLRAVNPDAEIIAYDPTPARAEALPGRTRVAASVEEAVVAADVIISAAPIVRDPHPTIHADMLRPRHLLLPIDFDAVVARDAIEAADLFLTDHLAQFDHYRGLGHFRDWPAPADAVGTRVRDDERPDRVVCCNLGVGALDAAFAALVHARAEASDIGTLLPR